MDTLLIILVVVLLVLNVGVIFFLFKNKQEKIQSEGVVQAKEDILLANEMRNMEH